MPNNGDVQVTVMLCTAGQTHVLGLLVDRLCLTRDSEGPLNLMMVEAHCNTETGVFEYI